jgi:hypothetical protein
MRPRLAPIANDDLAAGVGTARAILAPLAETIAP